MPISRKRKVKYIIKKAKSALGRAKRTVGSPYKRKVVGSKLKRQSVDYTQATPKGPRFSVGTRAGRTGQKVYKKVKTGKAYYKRGERIGKRYAKKKITEGASYIKKKASSAYSSARKATGSAYGYTKRTAKAGYGRAKVEVKAGRAQIGAGVSSGYAYAKPRVKAGARRVGSHVKKHKKKYGVGAGATALVGTGGFAIHKRNN